jgi:type I restriction enzyme R subunit
MIVGYVRVSSFEQNEERQFNELKWINRIEKYLLNESVINLDSFDESGTAFKTEGGFKRINKVFGGYLQNIIDELNFYLYDDGGNAA